MAPCNLRIRITTRNQVFLGGITAAQVILQLLHIKAVPPQPLVSSMCTNIERMRISSVTTLLVLAIRLEAGGAKVLQTTTITTSTTPSTTSTTTPTMPTQGKEGAGQLCHPGPRVAEGCRLGSPMKEEEEQLSGVKRAKRSFITEAKRSFR